MTGKLNFARFLRRNQTDAERRLWFRLRNRQLGSWKFRRQVPVDRFIADFLCEDARLTVELDGGQHGERLQEDAERTAVLEACGYRVARYWNAEVMQNIDGVLEDILARLEGR